MALGPFTLVAACAALAAALLAGLAVQLAPLARRVLRLQRVLVAPHEKATDALRIGLLGASFIGRAAVVHAADKRKDVVVVAVAARDADRAAAFAKRFGIASSYGGKDAYTKMLQHPGLDAVYVGLPTRLHYRWASAALAAGKHTLLEKPVAANGADAEALAAMAARSGLVLFEGAHYRYSLTAQLTLTVPPLASEASAWKPPSLVNATIEMARDRLARVFDWSLEAEGEKGSVHLANLGFPFLWHTVTSNSPAGHQREQLYGEGETTFEHQLGAFVAAVRGGSREAAGALSTMDVVDAIYKASGSGPIPSLMPNL